jgi:predicted nucleotidyltransferase
LTLVPQLRQLLGLNAIMQSAQSLHDQLRNLMPVLQQKYGVASLGIFGSYIRGTQRPEVDLVVREALKPTIGARILAEVAPV